MAKSRTMNLLVSAAALYVAVVGGMSMMQGSLIYPADQRRITPADLQRPEMSVVRVKTQDGITLEGWYKAPEAGKPTIVWFHGNGDHHAFSVFRVEPYIEQGYGILLTEYRGYAGNAGKPSEQGLYKDARAWLNSILQKGTKAQDIILCGQSLGTGVAVQMALEYPDMRALVLQSPYASLPDIARQRYFFLPVRLLMKDQYRSIDKIAKVKMPVLVINGEKDSIINPLQGKRLFEAANEPKSFVQLPDFGHNDMPPRPVAARVNFFLSGIVQGNKT